MKLIVGLGNPGSQYAPTRHNVGFMVVEKLHEGKKWAKSKSGLLHSSWISPADQKIELVKPQTFMNKSGEAVAYAVKKHAASPQSDLYVIHDDLDIALGNFKIQYGKGPKQHGGVDSIESILRTDQFYRVRIGVEGEARREQARTEKIPGKKYVLQPFSSEEKLIIDAVIEKVAKEVIKQILS